MLLCPVCHEPLVDDERGAACAGGHRFDRAREGYLYLLRSSKSGDSMGDPKSQARSRRDFFCRQLGTLLVVIGDVLKRLVIQERPQ